MTIYGGSPIVPLIVHWKSIAIDPLYGEALVVVLPSNSYKSLLHYPTTCSYVYGDMYNFSFA